MGTQGDWGARKPFKNKNGAEEPEKRDKVPVLLLLSQIQGASPLLAFPLKRMVDLWLADSETEGDGGCSQDEVLLAGSWRSHSIRLAVPHLVLSLR